jgi:hypothetical protein
VQRDHVGFAEELVLADALDVGREVAVDEVRIASDDGAENVARDVRHALADAPETEDAERELGGPREAAGAGVVPATGLDLAVVPGDVAHERERHSERVSGHLTDAVVGGVRHPHAVLARVGDVHRVVTRAHAAHDAQLGQRLEYLRVHRGVLREHPAAALPRRDHVVLGLALAGDDVHARLAEERELELDVGEVVVGDEELPGHPSTRRLSAAMIASSRIIRRPPSSCAPS